MRPTCAIYLPTPLDSQELAALDALLTERADAVLRAGQGRLFELLTASGSFDVVVQEVDAVLPTCEQEFAQLNLHREDAHTRIQVASLLDDPAAQAFVASLARAIHERFGGVRTGPDVPVSPKQV